MEIGINRNITMPNVLPPKLITMKSVTLATREIFVCIRVS